MTGDLVIGRLRATGLYRVHPTRDMRHPRLCGRCRPCPAAHRYARDEQPRPPYWRPEGGQPPRCALSGPVLAQIARRSCPSISLLQPGMERPERPRPPRSRPMTQSARRQICGLTAPALRLGLHGARMPKSRVDPSARRERDRRDE